MTVNTKEVLEAANSIIRINSENQSGKGYDLLSGVLARFARAALPLWVAVQEMPGEVREAMGRQRKISDNYRLHSYPGCLQDYKRISDWALTLTAKPEPKS